MSLKLVIAVFLGIILRSGLTPDDHAIYLSTARLSIDAPGGKAALIIKVFTDDLQSAIRNEAPQDYHISAEETFIDLHTEAIDRYFARHFKIRVDGKSFLQQFAHGVLENDVYLLHFQLEAPASWDSITLTADYFMELFPTQNNIIQLDLVGKKHYHRLQKNKDSITLDF